MKRAKKPAAVAGPGPVKGGGLSDELLGGAFRNLDAELPLLLLPVRVETHYNLSAKPAELQIRIYPEQLHIDAGQPDATESEAAATREFWSAWQSAKSGPEQLAAWRRFNQQVGSKRSGHLARTLHPRQGKNARQANVVALAKTAAQTAAPHPILLPRQWLAVGYGTAGEVLFSQASQPVRPGLRTGPDPAAAVVGVSGGGLEIDQGLAWMVDFQEAVQAGMALSVPLSGLAARAAGGVAVLLILGVQQALDPQAASDELARLFDVHARTSGLDFVPQGTPTNQTKDAPSGWTAAESDLAGLAQRQLTIPTKTKQPADDNAQRLAEALGLADASVLRRLENGAEPEARRSEQMRTALFEATLGTLLRQLLKVGEQEGLGESAISALRSWFIQHVSGGAPLSTLRVGPQPYGILPVRKKAAAPDLSSTAGQVERVVGLLSDVWRQSAAGLPVLAPDATASSGEFESTLAEILAAQPHPARLFLRRLEEYVEGQTAITIQATYSFFMATIDAAIDPNQYIQGISEAALLYRWLLPLQYPQGFQSIDDQVAFCALVEDTLRQRGLPPETLDPALIFMDDLAAVLNSYETRQRPLRWLGLEQYAGVLGETNTTLVAGKLYGESTEWGDAGLVQAPEAGAGNTAAEYLADLSQRFKIRSSDGSLFPSSHPPSPKPLLYQLLEQSLPLVPNHIAENRAVLAALDDLAALDPAQLEWLLRETLGLSAHRLDAWATSLASERLERLREKKPRGLQIGAFGWVLNLKPKRSKLASQGFIHAPSLAHATTAALLRSGWQAHGTQDPGSPAAVDLRSERVRTAAWLLDGVRQGQALGDLLGYRFERALHDAHADAQIRSVRQLVLKAQGKPNAAPDRPVDGIELLDLYRGGQLGTLNAAAKKALTDLESAFDAVEDISLFEAVHQLTGGNYERATALLDAVSSGSGALPELRAPLTPRSAQAVEHRVVILLRPDPAPAGRAWAAGIRDEIAPALEGWAAALLPPADEVGFMASEIGADGQAGPAQPLTLDQLGLSALDAVFLGGDDPLRASDPLRTLAAEFLKVEGSVQIDPAASASRVSLADFLVLAGELRRLLEGLHPLEGDNLRPAGMRAGDSPDRSAAQEAVQNLVTRFDRLGDDLGEAIEEGDLDGLGEAVCTLARFGISTGASPLNLEAAAALQPLFQRRLDAVTTLAVNAADPLPGLEARLAAALAGKLPILGKFTLDGAAAIPGVGPASEDEVDDWFDAVSRVRPEVGKLAAVGLLSELLGAGGLALSAGQTPLAAGEGWAATHLPAGAGRLSLVASGIPGGSPGAGELACGLFVDQWSEPVPAGQQVTGLAFHFNAPSNRPPQAWLLAVTPDGQPWSLQLVAETLLQTLDWSAWRAVGPEDLLDYGRALPAAFVPGSLQGWPQEAKS